MKKFFRKEVLIGASVIIALAILFSGIEFLKGVNVFKDSNYYYVSYSNVEGLAVSAPVNLNGFKVGQVRDISYQYDNPGHVLVELSLDKQLRVPQGSKAILKSDILGTASIELEMGRGDRNHSVGDSLIAEIRTGLMDNVSDNLMPDIAKIFPKIDTLVTNINSIVADPAITASVQRLNNITANLEQTTAKLSALMSTLQPITKDIKSITGNVDTMSGDLSELSRDLKSMPVDSLVGDLQTITGNLKMLTEQLNDKNSTLGLMMNDPRLYENINTTIQSLDSLFIDIKKNPKRYISIKLL